MSARQFSAGDLDRSITLEQRVVARDAATGAEQVSWSTAATVWAQVIESATASGGAAGVGKGDAEAMATAARPSRVRLRWRAGVERNTMRVNLGAGRLLRIIGVAELGRRVGLELASAEWAHE